MAKDKKELSDKQILKLLQKGTTQNIPAYLFLIPWLFGFALFTVGPFFLTFYLSFNDVTSGGLGWVIETPEAGVFGNYIVALFQNTEFVPAMIEFILLELTYVPTIIIISFILGLLLNRDLKFRSGFRTIFFLPVIVLSGSILDQLISTGSTELSDFSENLIFQMLENYSPFFAEVMLTLFTNFTTVLWFTGIPIILFINGLQKINKSLFEAARIDGATGWQILWKITIPIIKPTALIAAIFTIVQIGMYNINPVYTLIRDQMYNIAGGLGLASAYTWIYTIFVLLFVGAALLLLTTREKSAGTKLTSIQRKKFQELIARREFEAQQQMEEVEIYE